MSRIAQCEQAVVQAAVRWRDHELARKPSRVPGQSLRIASRAEWQRRNLVLIEDVWQAVDKLRSARELAEVAS